MYNHSYNNINKKSF